MKKSQDVVKVADFDYSIISRLPVLSPGKGKRTKADKGKKYVDAVCAFDIETSRLTDIEQSIMYIWQFQLDGICTIIGRTWDEYKEFVNNINDRLKADLVVFIHNASYEWQFLKSIFDFTSEDLFALDNRKVLRFKKDHIEYRCSYLQSNMSLAKFTETMSVKSPKLKGFDYEKIRYPWTDLTADELMYCINDVRGLVEAIKEEMKRDGDNLYTLPLTSTGYVRRDVKNSVETYLPHNWIQNILPDLPLYDTLLEAFRGGNTHANRYYTDEILSGVQSWDRSSSYPDVQINGRFPVGKFIPGETTEDYLYDLINVRKRSVLFRVAFYGVELIDPFYGCPYLSISKIRSGVNVVNDNGRVLKADYFETTLTDIDFRIVEDVYKWDSIVIIDLWHSKSGRLPKAITDVTIEYYRKKTALKGSGQDEYFYTKVKNKLNSVYGMSAQRPVRIPLIYEDLKIVPDPEADRAELLFKSNRKAFQSYAWGVWVTAQARLRLHEGIQMAGDGFVYCDTDSVKYFGSVDWSEYNDERMRDSLDNGAYADDRDGVRHYMGVYEKDGEYEQFKTLGAKKYCYVDKSGKLSLTVAGVNKKKGAVELEEAGGIEAFREGFVFYAGGGTESVYNDLPDSIVIYREGRPLLVTSNVVIRPSTYTLALTPTYHEVVNDAKRYRQSIIDLGLR